MVVAFALFIIYLTKKPEGRNCITEAVSGLTKSCQKPFYYFTNIASGVKFQQLLHNNIITLIQTVHFQTLVRVYFHMQYALHFAVNANRNTQYHILSFQHACRNASSRTHFFIDNIKFCMLAPYQQNTKHSSFLISSRQSITFFFTCLQPFRK